MSGPSFPVSRLSRACLLGLATFVAAPAVSATESSFLYSLTASGRTSLQVTPLENLSTFNGALRFSDLVAIDGNRWALSVNGKVYANGTLAYSLPFPAGDATGDADQTRAWIRLLMDVDGVLSPTGPVTNGAPQVVTLSAGGLVLLNGEQLADLPVTDLALKDGEFKLATSLFVDMVISDVGAFALRMDGMLYDVELGTPVGVFRGGPAIDGALDGNAPHTQWMRITHNPINGLLYALRADGVVISVDSDDVPLGPDDKGDVPLLGDDIGKVVARLPGTAFGILERANLYVDLEVSSGGSWNALRRDGAVFAANSKQVPYLSVAGGANFVGNPSETPLTGSDRQGNPFIDMVLADGVVWRVRWLGQFYQGSTLVDQLLNSDFVRLAVDDSQPNLSDIANKRPDLTVYKSRVIEGSDVVIPVIPVDLDQPVDELTLDIDLSGLPGATYDAITGEVTAPGGLPAGRYSIRVTVDDGGPQKPVSKRYPVRVLDPTAKGGKVRAPLPTRMSRSLALIGRELSLPVFASDRNGDDLTIEPLDKGIFRRGATFDADTNTLHWLPECIDAGPRQAVFRVTNGTKTSRLKVPIDVLFPLFWDPVIPVK